MSIERTNPVTGTELQRRWSQQYATGPARMGGQEIHTAVDHGGWVRLYCAHRHVGGYYHHGVVAGAAAMLDLDHPESLHACLPGDTCHRSDTGLLMVCIAGNGLSEADWISAGGGSGAAWGSITGTLSNQTDLASALSGKAASIHTHTRADIQDASVAGRAIMAVDTPAGPSVPVVAADGSASLALVSSLGGGGATLPVAHLSRSANQSISGSAAIQWQAATVFAGQGLWSAGSPTRLVATAIGLWRVSVWIRTSNVGAIYFSRNGTTYHCWRSVWSGGNTELWSADVVFTDQGYLEVWAYSVGAATITFEVDNSPLCTWQQIG